LRDEEIPSISIGDPFDIARPAKFIDVFEE
jgi:hypothetical protein